MIVYDITSRESFEHVPGWLREVQANIGGPHPGQCVLLLVGHKADQADKRQVHSLLPAPKGRVPLPRECKFDLETSGYSLGFFK